LLTDRKQRLKHNHNIIEKNTNQIIFCDVVGLGMNRYECSAVTPPIAAADILLAPPPTATAGQLAAASDHKYPARCLRLRKTGTVY